MRSVTILVAAVLFLIAAGFAQSSPPQPTRQLSPGDVQTLLNRIDKLEKRVAELEAREGVQTAPVTSPAKPTEVAGQGQPSSTAVPAEAAAETKQKTQERNSTGSEMGEMPGMHTVYSPENESYPNLKLRGFADVDFNANDRPAINPSAGPANSGFSLGQFVLHFASALSPKVSYFAEISLTPTSGVYNVDLERSIIRYDVNDVVKVSFGRYHTPINYWNTAFHHGAWLQTTVSRPDMIVFGGRFIPVHFIGAQSEGNIPSGPLGVGYNIGIGNGRASNVARAGDNGDVNNNRAWLANFYLRPPALKHFQVGGSVYNDEISLSGASTIPQGPAFREWIASGHLVWTGETPEFLAEFANVHHRSIFTGRTYDNQGGYVQFAYRLPFNQKKWKPYFRYDYLQVPPGEPTFPDFVNVRKSTLGMRYDITDFAAFKAEYRNGSGNPLPQRSNALAMQTAFTF